MTRKLPIGKAEASDPALHMEMETLRAEREEQLMAETAKTDRETIIAEYYDVVGRIKGVKVVTDFGNVAGFLWIQQVRERKLYKNIPGVGTWDKFCDSIGMCRRKVEENLANLAVFGETFTATVAAFGVGYRDLRKLRQLTHDGTVVIDGDCLQIENESIPINEDHAEELQAAIERIISDRAQINARVEKLEKQFKSAVDEEVKGFKVEKKALVERVKELEKYEPANMDDSHFEEQYETIRDQINSLACQIGKLVMVEGLHQNPLVAAKVEGHIASAERLVEDLRRDWTAKFQIF